MTMKSHSVKIVLHDEYSRDQQRLGSPAAPQTDATVSAAMLRAWEEVCLSFAVVIFLSFLQQLHVPPGVQG